jgi:hypothetical protein
MIAQGAEDPSEAPIAEEEPLTFAPAPEPLSLKERIPVLAVDDLEGVWPDEAPQVVPGEKDPVSPTDVVDELSLKLGQGSANTDAYAVPEAGTHVDLVTAAPSNVLVDGKWEPLDLAVDEKTDAWEGRAESATATFPKELGEASPVTVAFAGGSLAFALKGAAGTGIAEGATVTYPEALEGADLVYRMLPDGVKEEIVLHDAKAPSSFAYLVAATGLELAPNATGGIDVLAAGAWVAELPPVLVSDSSPEPHGTVGTYALADLGDGTFQLDVTFDATFLEIATFPVTVDPGVTWGPDRDLYVDSGSPNGDFGGATTLKSGQGLRTFIRFDTSPREKPDRLVYDATLWLYPTATGGVNDPVKAKHPDASWPNPMTWNNQPGVDPGV